MITRPDSAQRENRVFRIALVASVLAHVLFAVLAIFTSDIARRALHLDAIRPPKPVDEIVTISSALRLEKRAKPEPVVQHRPAPARVVPQPPAPQRLPAPEPRPALPPAAKPVTTAVRKPALPRPVALERELAKLQQRAPAQPSAAPAKATYAPRVSRGEGTQVASLGKSIATQRRPSAHEPVPGAKFSDERLAQIERDLAKTIAQTRSETNPLRTVPRETPAAPKRYRLQMQGMSSSLRRGEGYYYPVKSWRANGLDYYYVSYDFTWPNGVYETGSVPWPIHFTPGGDPFLSADPARVNRTPLPPPPPGYAPPGTLGKALRAYFPKLVFSDSDS